jgi:hypothetical protein
LVSDSDDSREEAGVAEVVRLLAAQFHAGEQHVADAAGAARDDQVGLVEQVLAGRRVVVGRDGDAGARRVDRAREHVLVELVVVAEAETILQRDAAAEAMFDGRRQQVHGRVRRALIGIAEERLRIGVSRLPSPWPKPTPGM